MKVFISWSGTKGQKVADALHPWLRRVLQFVEPLVSTRIEKGAQWNAVLARQLDESRAGIVCVTRESLNSRWLHYEAGALSKVVEGEGGDEQGTTAVLTYLVDVAPTDVEYPLAQFQHTLATREDTLELVLSINRIGVKYGASTLSEEDVREIFAQWWPKLEAKLKEIAGDPESDPALKPEVRKERDLLEELLELVRGLYRRDEAVSPTPAESSTANRFLDALARGSATWEQPEIFYNRSILVEGSDEQINRFIEAARLQRLVVHVIKKGTLETGERQLDFYSKERIPQVTLDGLAKLSGVVVRRSEL